MKLCLWVGFVCCLAACSSSEAQDTETESFSASSKTLALELIPKLIFRADWSIIETSSLVGGYPVDLIYDIARQPGCRRTYNGLPAWSVWVNYRIDDGRVGRAFFTMLVNGVQEVNPVRIQLPAGSRKLAVWFESSGIGGCHTYDSNFGLDYTFDIE